MVAQTFEKGSKGESNEEVTRFNAPYRDRTCQKFILLAMENYTECLSLDTKHLYQALPRLLSLWFDFVSVSVPANAAQTCRKEKIGTSAWQRVDARLGAVDLTLCFHRSYTASLVDAQGEAQALMASNLKKIHPSAFYTALPQLISHLFSEDSDTIMVVKKILGRVLYKFPEQAMWHFAWLTGSKSSERVAIGREIFKDAQKVLLKTNNREMVPLLKDGESLFRYFREIAR